jgi:hypothetical protein
MSSLPIRRMRAATISRRRNSVPTPPRRRVARLDHARDQPNVLASNAYVGQHANAAAHQRGRGRASPPRAPRHRQRGPQHRGEAPGNQRLAAPRRRKRVKLRVNRGTPQLDRAGSDRRPPGHADLKVKLQAHSPPPIGAIALTIDMSRVGPDLIRRFCNAALKGKHAIVMDPRSCPDRAESAYY